MTSPATKPATVTAASPQVADLLARYHNKTAVLGVIGLGYVGLPLSCAACTAGFKVVGFDVDPTKIEKLSRGESYIGNIHNDKVSSFVNEQKFSPTADYNRLAEVDAIIMCVPTPLNKNREPDMTYIERTTEAIAPRLKKGHLVVLESTTYPGTTEDVVRPILERVSGLKAGVDFFLAFSPEREDPGNAKYHTSIIPKVVGGVTPDCLALSKAMYDGFLAATVPVSTAATAEAVKLTENIFRAVNIALVNELKVVYDAMGIDIWEVIDAAKTKPFGYMPFYPGPGLGGHCIPIDPFYLTWKAREHGIATRFIELAGEINVSMPRYVVNRLSEQLDVRFGKGLKDANVLMIGVAYKKNVADERESPAFTIMDMLESRHANVTFHDPHVAKIPPKREHGNYTGRTSVELTAETIAAADVVLIVTDHDGIDYNAIAKHAKLVVDTRNAMAGITDRHNIVKA